jgi:hypothetical protein
MCLFVVIGFTSLAIDIGIFLHERQNVQNAVDAAALAGAQELPDNGATAQSIAEQWAESNDPDITSSQLSTSFRCIIGDRNLDGQPDLSDVPVVCDPGAGAQWTCTGNICWSHCNFSNANNKCNTIVLGADKDVPFYFAPVLSGLNGPTECFFDECNTGSIRAAACKGACGGPPSAPLDVVIVIDRTWSLCTDTSIPCDSAHQQNLDAIKDGARTVLQLYNPSLQHVGLAVLPKSVPANDCQSVTSNTASGNWMITNLSSNYNTNGVLNSGSEIVSNVNCLQMATLYPPSPYTQTNLGDPLTAAKNHLQSSGRANVKDAIIFLTDGAANEPQFTGTAGNTGNRNCSANAAVNPSGDNNGFEGGSVNACSDASGQATDTNSGTGTSTSCTNSGKDRHVFRDYNISIPAGATINGINLRLDAWADSSSSSPSMCAELSWNGGATWTSPKQTSSLSNSQATYNLGGSTDDWGHSWTAADTSNANFRVRITNVSSSTSRDFNLDWAAINVHYTVPPPLVGSCNYANQEATTAKAAEVEIFTIGFGLESETCQYDAGSPYDGAEATELLADMATDSADDHGGCDNAGEIAAENADGDHFLCEASGGDLTPLFQQAAEILAQGSKMVPVFD